jgi:MFS transporter, DHA2 family, multidrug resistance protein
MITHQAQIIAYIDEFKLLMIWMLVVNPLLIAFKRAGGGKDQTLVME